MKDTFLQAAGQQKVRFGRVVFSGKGETMRAHMIPVERPGGGCWTVDEVLSMSLREWHKVLEVTQ